MPFTVNSNININVVAVLLTIIAILVGTLVAIQGSASVSLTTVGSLAEVNQTRISDLTTKVEDLQRKFSDFKQSNDNFQAEERQGLVNLSQTLNAIQVEQAKKGKTR